MASFQSRIDRKRMRKGENKNYRFVPFLPDAIQKIPQKQQKNSKIKIVWKWPRKRENKNYHFVRFLPDALQKIAKK